MEKDPTKDDQPSGDQSQDEPASTDGPGKVTVDEPTKPALSGAEEEDFGGADEGSEEDA
jgi:hypothetical protein